MTEQERPAADSSQQVHLLAHEDNIRFAFSDADRSAQHDGEALKRKYTLLQEGKIPLEEFSASEIKILVTEVKHPAVEGSPLRFFPKDLFVSRLLLQKVSADEAITAFIRHTHDEAWLLVADSVPVPKKADKMRWSTPTSEFRSARGIDFVVISSTYDYSTLIFLPEEDYWGEW